MVEAVQRERIEPFEQQGHDGVFVAEKVALWRDLVCHLERVDGCREGGASVCPITGQPDFATITIDYVPAEKCVELKSLKLYLWSYRQEGHFHEAVTNLILDDLIAAIAPRSMTVEGDFAVRGGIHTVVTASHEKK